MGSSTTREATRSFIAAECLISAHIDAASILLRLQCIVPKSFLYHLPMCIMHNSYLVTRTVEWTPHSSYALVQTSDGLLEPLVFLAVGIS